MTPIVRAAHAKLNVFLRVLGRRPDGYHDIESLILPISLHDVITVEPAEGLGVEVVGPTSAAVPAGQENLALRAAVALAAEAGGAGRAPGAKVLIEKRIPVAAGLGGGSADAAAALLALDELWSLGLGAAGLMDVARSVGSDVPALLLGEPAYVRERGDVVERVLVQPTTWVLATTDVGVSAGDAYAWWDADPSTGPDPGALIAAAETGNDRLLGSAIFNDLQGPVTGRHPWVAATCGALVAAGAHGAVMTGSGPTAVALCSFATARDVADAVPGSLVVDAPPRASTPERLPGSGVV
jgi:4-diphosphocytidyl-2-C-methyl-D-erythritol kinase